MRLFRRAFEIAAVAWLSAVLALALLTLARASPVQRQLELEYEPFTEFRRAPVRSPELNVSAEGYRHVADQAPWPPRNGERHVFVFGGSTTFGRGLSDGDTMPSQLQRRLRAAGHDVAIWNWARPLYGSTQERILFEQLLVSGLALSAAVFVDGPGETEDGGLALLPHRWRSALSPVYQRGYELGERHRTRGVLLMLVSAFRPQETEAAAAEPDARGIAERWRRNAALVSSRGIPVVLVWEPAGPSSASRATTARMARLRAEGSLPPDLLWLGDLSGDHPPHGAPYARELAGRIAGVLASSLR